MCDMVMRVEELVMEIEGGSWILGGRVLFGRPLVNKGQKCCLMLIHNHPIISTL
jgi:hypothetical protein